jgi:hypothetical protein
LVGVVAPQFNLQIRKERELDRQNGRNQKWIGIRRFADIQDFNRSVENGAGGKDSVLKICKYLTRFGNEYPARIRKLGSLMIVPKDLKADNPLQFQDLLAERGLGDMQPLGCSRKMQFLCNHNGCLQQSDLWQDHDHPPRWGFLEGQRHYKAPDVEKL